MLRTRTVTVTALLPAAALLVVPFPTGLADEVSGSADTQRHRHVFWRLVRPNGTTIYLLGSLHFGDDRLYPLPEAVIDAYEICGTVVFETDLRGAYQGAFAAHMQAAAAGPQDISLFDRVSPELAASLRVAVQRLGLDLERFSRSRPWYCANSLMTAALRQAGVDSTKGIDQTVLRLAERDAKTCVALETPEFQLDLFAGMNDHDAIALLAQAAEEVDATREFVEGMLTAYLRGDLDTLHALISAGFADYPDLRRRFFTERNQAWARRLQSLAEEAGRIFVVVGTGHLLGPEGLVVLLERVGFTAARR